jgi:6-pyruvoyl-tetrahydropterin synthase
MSKDKEAYERASIAFKHFDSNKLWYVDDPNVHHVTFDDKYVYAIAKNFVRLDHALVVPKSSIMLSHLKNCDTKLVITDYQPTCENLLIDFAKRLKANLPENVSLARLCLYETASSYAEWLAEDNEL